MREYDLIDKYLRPLTKNHPASLDLRDDAAIITPRTNCQLVATKDCIVENVHFLTSTSPENIAKKLVGVNLSDIAAMGAKPLYGMISATLSDRIDEHWIQNFCSTLSRLNNKYNICLIGGDTTKYSEGPLVLSMTMIGEVDKYKAIRQDGAHPGDNVYVTGNIGDAAIGLEVAKGNFSDLDRATKVYFEQKYNAPEPQVDLGQKLNNSATSMTDISDGFVSDLEKIATHSNVSIEINQNLIPFSTQLKKLMSKHDLLEKVLTGGDDYELVFTAPKIFDSQIFAIANSVDTKVTRIGTVISGKGIKIIDADGNKLNFIQPGYEH